jgi:hypothetical protein
VTAPTPTLIPWACPKCGAEANKHGRGGREACKDRLISSHGCEGFMCECWEDDSAENQGDGPDHGQSFGDPCKNAHCFHCGWHGVFPVKPRGLSAWEKKALDAGWTMPTARAKELGL